MIHKRYKTNGKPDLRAWKVECDSCYTQHLLSDTTDWLIPSNPNMWDYCPDCHYMQAMVQINIAIRCPACQSSDIRIATANRLHFAACRNCTAILWGTDVPGSVDGWVITPPPF